MYAEMLANLENAAAPSILVVGDLMLDRYLWGDVDRVSPEAPVPVVQVDRARTHATVGGAGSVVRDLLALGARVTAAGVVGDDAEGREIVEKLDAEGADTSLVVVDRARGTTQKTRVISKSNHLLRIDSEDRKALEPSLAARLVAGVTRAVADVDFVILSDYDKGVLSAEAIAEIVAAAREAGAPVWADPAKGRRFSDFRGVTAVTPNRRETEEATGIAIPAGTLPEEAAEWLIRHLGLDLVLVTLDSEGLYYRTGGGEGAMVTAKPRAAYDVTGAGDMVIASAAYGLASGMSLAMAMAFANFCAGMEVERVGAQPVARTEVIRRLRGETGSGSEKVLGEADLVEALAHRRRRGERIVFTNGCFDILHMGHVKYLEFARAQGGCLVVGLNSDASVRALKEPPRPVLGQDERAGLLAALAMVDYVVIFDEPTPERLINSVAPDILVKGEDWREKGVVGRESVEARGGRVILAPLVAGVSTTGIVKRILDAYSGGKRSE